MANYTGNLNLILPGDDDYALVENLTDDFQAIDDFAGDVVKVYDPTTTHSKREYCLFQDHVYKCNSFITQPEAFDPSKWDRVILGDEIRNNNSYITNLQSGLAIVQDGDTATKAITQGQYVLWKSSMRYAKANIAIGETLSSTNLGSVTYDNGALNRLNEHIGSLSSLTTTAKTNIVSAINEVNSRTQIGNDFSFTGNSSTLGSTTATCKRIGKLCILNLNGIYKGSATSGWSSIGTVSVSANDTYYSSFSTGTGSRECRISGSSIDVYNNPGAGNDCLGQIVFIST